MSDQIISVDAGNGGTNAILAKQNGKTKSVYFPSVRAAATGDSLGLGASMEMQVEYADWNGHRYVIGDDVVRVTRRHLERHLGTNRYGNEFHQMLIAYALAKLGVKKGGVDLTLFAPPGMYKEAKEAILQSFGDGTPTIIKLKGDTKAREWLYDSVDCLPEGVGAAICFALDDTGKPTNSDLLNGENLILDLGAFTLDALKLVDGNFNPENLEHATWENGGLDVHIRQEILRTIKSKSDEFANVTVDDIDLVIRQGLVSGEYLLCVAGQKINIQPLIDKRRERYAEWIANNIIDNTFDGLRGIKSMILVGGGTCLVEEYLRLWYGDKLLNTKKNLSTKNIHPVDFNAVGGLRFALMKQKGR